MPIKNHDFHGIDPKRKVLYRNFHDIRGTVYLVEISRNALKVFILLFPNFEIPDIFLSEIMPEKKAQKLMTDSNNMFEELISKFYVKYGKLQIAGFHGQQPDPRRHITVSPTSQNFMNQGGNYNMRMANTYGFNAPNQTQQQVVQQSQDS